MATGESIPLRCLEGSPAFPAHLRMKPASLGHLSVCADTKFNVIYGLVLITLLWGMDSLGIFVSYVFILHSVLKISSQEGRFKALNTCASHICAVLILYVPMIGLSIVHRFAKHSSPLIHIFMAHIYLLVPPVLNPVIYSV